ncbi:MAG: hypothetical protein ABI328_11035 [Gemmatimonadaceae bacterium]
MASHSVVVRRGFILVEALIALLVLGVAFVAFESSLAVIIRSVAASEREATAARLAEAQRENAFSIVCGSGSGADSVDGVVVAWTASAAAPLVHLTQTSSYESRFGQRVETYDATGRCY